jgi:S1-C subfamily serine protease
MFFFAYTTTIPLLVPLLPGTDNTNNMVVAEIKAAAAQKQQKPLLLSLPSSLLSYGYANGTSNSSIVMINSSYSPSSSSSYSLQQLLSLPPPDIFDRVKPSVVQITPISLSHGQYASSLLGSGFVYDKEGHILTNSHVVENARLRWSLMVCCCYRPCQDTLNIRISS